MDYRTFKEKQSEEFNKFSKENIIVLLCSKEEAETKLQENNLTVEDIVNIGGGAT